ncbi:MAG: Methylmalonyl-CoA mutase large subunit [bacterium ADurb.Bin425]|nr:MAG: Methylmalonyl-CoA mutase large subunit [bacterium ADurb.Bin425]
MFSQYFTRGGPPLQYMDKVTEYYTLVNSSKDPSKDSSKESGQNVFRPQDLAGFQYDRDLGEPGRYPFTRGIYRDMYRSRFWTMRQYAGFGDADATNRRFRYLLDNGQTGLSVAFDLPTQMGLDSDDAMALGEVGRTGVAIDTLKDMERLFDQIDLGKVSTSMTINSTSAILLAMYRAVGVKQGVNPRQLAGTIQNDILKEYEARNTYIFPPRGSMRLITDIFQYCSKEMPRWNTISISGYHIREAGATAVQELAFTFANAIEYVRAAISTGLDVDDFAPQLSFFFVAQMNFFEEVAKFRAARRLWAKIMKNMFNAKSEKSMNLRFHVQTAGSSLTLQQPDNNIVRTTLEALAAALGGCQSLHTNSKDEAIALPTEASALTALRTQQIIAFESGVGSVVDPVGGSYYIESLTSKIEAEVEDYLKRIEEMGGAIKAVESGFIQKEIQDAAYEYHQEVEAGRKQVVGVNCFIDEEEEQIPVQRIAPELETRQVEALKKVRAERDNAKVERLLKELTEAAAIELAQDSQPVQGQAPLDSRPNLIPLICDAVEAYASVGEISGALKKSFGKFRPMVTI